MATNKRITESKKALKKIDKVADKYKKIAKRAESKVKSIILSEGTVRPLTANKKAQAVLKQTSKKINKQLKADLKTTTVMSERYLAIGNIKLNKKDREIIKAKIDIILAEVDGLTNKAKKDIAQMMTNNLGRKQTYEQLVTGLASVYPSYASHLSTLSVTSLQRFYKDTNWAKESQLNECFKYVGPDDKVTRPYCAEHVGNIYTKEEAEKIEAEIQGFYNCRHMLVPVSADECKSIGN